MKVGWRLLVVLAAQFLWTLPATGQDSTLTESTIVPDTVRRIPQAEMADRAEEAAARLRAAYLLLEPDPRIDEIVSEWPGFRSGLDQLKARTSEAGLETPQSAVDELIRRWEGRHSRLEAWQDLLSSRIDGLSREAEGLDEIRKQWTATRRSAVEEDLPETIILQIDSVISVSSRLLPPIREARDEVLDLQGRLTYENVSALAAQERLRALRSRALTERFSLRQSPLWNAMNEQPAYAGDEATLELRRSLSDTREYLVDRVGYVTLQLLLIIILGLAFRPVSVQLERIQENETARLPAGIFRRPFLPAILIGLLATPFIYPDPPATILSYATVLSIPLTIILLLQQARPRVRPMIVGLGALVVLFVVSRLFVPPGGYLQRFAMFGLSVATCLSAAWLVFRSETRHFLNEGGFGRILLNVARFGILLSVVVIVANLLGYGIAADHTFRAIIVGTYSGLYLFVGAQIINGAIISFLDSSFAQRSNSVRSHARRIAISGMRLVNIASFVYWLYISLDLLGIFDPLFDAAIEVLGTPWGIGELQLSFLDVLAFLVTLWASIKISQVIRVILNEDVFGRMDLARGLPIAISNLSFYFLVALSFLFALSAAGVPLDRLALITGALGIGIGFGLQDVVRNFLSGIILMVERPIKIGDVIEFGSDMGTVQKIGIRSSVVRSFEGADIIVPNGHLVTSDVKNWTLDDTSRRIDINFTVDFKADPERVTEILLEIGNGYDKVAQDPPPAVVFTGFSDRGMSFSLRCWVHDPTGWLVKRNELAAMIHKRLKEAGIEFSSLPRIV